jgi:DNA gyrase/topoisomerase IV subunit A
MAIQRLAILDAFLLAVKHRDRVLAAVAGARDPDEARRSVAELLGIDEGTAAAEVVVDARLRSFSQSKVAEVQSERDALKRRLDQGL